MKGVKFKTPPRESEELGRFYDLVFDPDTFFASWCGRSGQYAYAVEGKPWSVADNQDGYIYLWPRLHHTWTDSYYTWDMTANPNVAARMCPEYVEINL